MKLVELRATAGGVGRGLGVGKGLGVGGPNNGSAPVSPADRQRQAMLNDKVEKLLATVSQQQKQIEALTAGLQKVSAQLEVSKPAPQTVKNTD